MTRSLRERFFFILSILFGAAPLAFGLIRAVSTGSDFRLLWIAFASYMGAGGALIVSKALNGTTKSGRALSGLVFIAATVISGLAAYLLGATAAAGVWGVAVIFGVCCAASHMSMQPHAR